MSFEELSRQEEHEKVIVNVDQSVTGLLSCTKQLLEALMDWSTQSGNKGSIYGQFESLETYFNSVCQAFNDAQLNMDDLAHIPQDLQQCLQAALSQDPSVLEHHLPSIRDIILQLLQGLKRKQALLHEKSLAFSSFSSTNNCNNDIDNGCSSIGSPRKVEELDKMTPSTSTSSELNMSDPGTQQAFSQLRQDDDLATRSSTRKGNNSNAIETVSCHLPNNIQPPERRRHGSPVLPSQPVLPFAKPDSAIPFVLFLQWKHRIKRVVVTQSMDNMLQVFQLFRHTFPLVNETDYSSSIISILDKDTEIMYELDNIALVQPNSFLSLGDRHSLCNVNIPVINDDDTNSASTHVNVSNINSEIMETIRQALKQQFDQWTLVGSTLLQNNNLTPSVSTCGVGATTDQEIPTALPPQNGYQLQPQQQQHQITMLQEISQSLATLQQTMEKYQQSTESMMSQFVGQQQRLTTFNINDRSRNVDDQRCHGADADDEDEDDVNDDGNGGDGGDDDNSRCVVDDGGDDSTEEVKERDVIKKTLQGMGQTLTTRIEQLQDTIDDMKQDVTQRRCRPSSNQLEHCHKESKAVHEMIQSLDNYIKQSKPTWKKSWEEQLQQIVNEQQCVKEYEHMVTDFEEDHSAIVTVLEHLTLVSELQRKSGSKPVKLNVGVFSEIMKDNNDYAGAAGGREGMGYVLQQLQTIDVNHEKRLDALAQAEKRRARDMANRIDDFEKELITFVDTNKLKKTGGPEQLERQQQQKTKQLLLDLYENNKKPT